MKDPGIALFLYLAIVISSLLLGSSWREFYATVIAASKSKVEEAPASSGSNDGKGE